MSTSTKKPVNRPLVITLTCAILFLLGLLLIVYTFAYTGDNPEFVFYPAAHTFIIVIVFAALSGIWNMEKWGVWIFVAAISIKIALDLIVHVFGWWELSFLVPIAIFLYYLKRMK